MAKRKRSSGRSAAQRRATAKLVAFNRSKRRTRANPKRRIVKRRRNPAPLAALANPRRRRRSSSRRAVSRVSRRTRRNPSLRVGNAVREVIKPAITQAFGGLLLDVAMGYIPLPGMLATGYAKSLAKVGVAVLIGIVGQKVTKGSTAKQLALGASTIAIHDLLKGLVQQNVPQIRLGGDDDFGDVGYTNFAPSWDSSSDDMGELFLTNQGMGEYSDAGVGDMAELFNVGGDDDWN